MNIFCTNECPVISAKEHCKVHNRKMIVELAQMLSTAHRVLDGNDQADKDSLYKKTHENHPSSVWVRASVYNYQWAYKHFKALCHVYAENTGKVHKTADKLLQVLEKAPAKIPQGKHTLPTPAVPDKYKNLGDVPTVYKRYLNDKFKEWTSREKPVKVEWYGSKPGWVKSI